MKVLRFENRGSKISLYGKGLLGGDIVVLINKESSFKIEKNKLELIGTKESFSFDKDLFVGFTNLLGIKDLFNGDS